MTTSSCVAELGSRTCLASIPICHRKTRCSISRRSAPSCPLKILYLGGGLHLCTDVEVGVVSVAHLEEGHQETPVSTMVKTLVEVQDPGRGSGPWWRVRASVEGEDQYQDPGGGSEHRWRVRVRVRIRTQMEGHDPSGGSGPRWWVKAWVKDQGQGLGGGQVSAHVIRVLERRSSWSKQSLLLNMLVEAKANRLLLSV